MAAMDKLKTIIYCHGKENIEDQLGSTMAYVNDNEHLELCGICIDPDGKRWNEIEEACDDGIECVVIQKMLTEDAVRALPALVIGTDDYFFSDDEPIELESEWEIIRNHAERAIREEAGNQIRTGIRKKMERLEAHSNVPYGYLKDGTEMVVDPVKAPYVRQIFEWKRDGVSTSEIVRRLDERGILTPSGAKGWNNTTVKNILRNEAYAGVYVGGKVARDIDRKRVEPKEEVIRAEGHHEGIVDELLFKQVQFILDDEGKAKGNKDDTDLFKEIIRCGVCGGGLTYLRKDEKARRTKSIYYCRYHTGKTIRIRQLDKKPQIGAEELERIVVDKCNDHIDALNALIEGRDEIKSGYGHQIDVAREKLHELGKQQYPIYMQFKDGQIAKENCRTQMQAACDHYKGVSRGLGEARYNLALFRVMMSDLDNRFGGEPVQRMTTFEPDTGEKLIERLELNEDGMIDLRFTFEGMIDQVQKAGSSIDI